MKRANCQKSTIHQNRIQNEHLPTKKTTDPDGFTSKYCQNIKGKTMPILYTFLRESKMKNAFQLI